MVFYAYDIPMMSPWHPWFEHIKLRLAQNGPEPVVGVDAVEVARVALLHDAATEGVFGDVDAMAIAVLRSVGECWGWGQGGCGKKLLEAQVHLSL